LGTELQDILRFAGNLKINQQPSTKIICFGDGLPKEKQYKMEYIHYQIRVFPHNNIVVTVDKQANIKLLNTIMYERYKSGKHVKASLEFLDSSGTSFKVPYKGEWHVIVEHGNYHGKITARVDIE